LRWKRKGGEGKKVVPLFHLSFFNYRARTPGPSVAVHCKREEIGGRMKASGTATAVAGSGSGTGTARLGKKKAKGNGRERRASRKDRKKRMKKGRTLFVR
jgi:hypothetical protein